MKLINKKGYQATYFFTNEKGENKWENGFNIYTNEYQANKFAEKDFEKDTHAKIKGYVLKTWIINEINIWEEI